MWVRIRGIQPSLHFRALDSFRFLFEYVRSLTLLGDSFVGTVVIRVSWSVGRSCDSYFG